MLLGTTTWTRQAEAFHNAHPDKPVMGTETVSAVGTRGIYITDAKRASSVPTIRTPPPAAPLPKAGGASATRVHGSLAALSGPASIIAASPRPTAGRTSVRNTASSTPADSRKTPSSTTSPGGPASLCCTSFRTGTGPAMKARRSPSGSTRISTKSSSSTTARASAQKT